MISKRLLASILLVLWLLLLAFTAGPVRWEFAHTYAHWIEPIGNALPTPTSLVGLPLLDLGESDVTRTLIAAICWGVVWLGPLVLLFGVWRVASREALLEWLLLGGGLYGLLVMAITLFALFSLWLPFSLL